MRVSELRIAGFGGFKSPRTFKLDPNITTVTGRNGAGKSTIIEAVSTALYGKSLRYNRGQPLWHDDNNGAIRAVINDTVTEVTAKDKKLKSSNITPPYSPDVFKMLHVFAERFFSESTSFFQTIVSEVADIESVNRALDKLVNTRKERERRYAALQRNIAVLQGEANQLQKLIDERPSKPKGLKQYKVDVERLKELEKLSKAALRATAAKRVELGSARERERHAREAQRAGRCPTCGQLLPNHEASAKPHTHTDNHLNSGVLESEMRACVLRERELTAEVDKLRRSTANFKRLRDEYKRRKLQVSEWEGTFIGIRSKISNTESEADIEAAAIADLEWAANDLKLFPTWLQNTVVTEIVNKANRLLTHITIEPIHKQDAILLTASNRKGARYAGFSAGEKRVTNIAIFAALQDYLKTPRILFFDEAFDGLDAENRELAVKLIKNLSAKHQCVILSHSQDLLAYFGNNTQITL